MKGPVFTNSARWRRPGSIVILGASVLYGVLEVPPLLFGLFGGLFAGLIYVAIAEAIVQLAGALRRRFPRAASYSGPVIFWLGAVVLTLNAGFLIWTQAPVRLIGTTVALIVFYGSVCWNIRHELPSSAC